jgi:uncharacterized protein
VKAGDVVKVRVKEVDVARKRIALTMKSGPIERSAADAPRSSGAPSPQRSSAPPPKSESGGESALAAAMRRAQERK